MNSMYFRIYRIIVVTVCSALLLTPGGSLKAQELENETVYLPMIQTVPTASLVLGSSVGKKSTLPLDQVELSLRRRAAQHVEDVRNTDMAPGWERAYLGAEVRLLYRPDVEDVAYYEFPVFAPAMQGEPAPAGFIILSSGEHDIPVPHWSFNGEAPSQELEQEAAARDIHEDLTFYKLDVLSYAAEDAQGQLVVATKDLPPKVIGMDKSMLDAPEQPSESSWIPDESQSDVEAEKISGKMVYEGPQDTPVTLGSWESWEELKAQYSDSYGVFIEELRRDAVTDWSILETIGQDGEVLVEETTYTVTLLSETAKIVVSGDGAKYVSSEQINRAGLPAALQLTAVGADPTNHQPFNVEIIYVNGEVEQLHFLVVARDNVQPKVASQVETTSGVVASGSTPTGPWSSWSMSMAGAPYQQRLYNQIESGDWPNTSNCYSGCGATAWAMLFGWADLRASEGDPYWAPRWGLYRQNGGKHPTPNDVAPATMTSGAKNMIWEIRNHIGTFCSWFSEAAPTLPAGMSNAAKYFVGRTGTRLKTDFSRFGISWDSFRSKTANHIIERKTPVVIGTGWFSHYPLAYGYRYRTRPVEICYTDGQRPWEQICTNQLAYHREFMVNQGWGGEDNDWIRAKTWFVGEIFPH